MRRVVLVSALLGMLALLAAPVAAQDSDGAWRLNAHVGPAFGTFGTTPNFDVEAGYAFNNRIAFVGEVGALSHAPFDKAKSVAPAVPAPDSFRESKVHVNGYHYNGNLLFEPANRGPLTPYATIGIGAFRGSTVAEYTTGQSRRREYEAATHFAANLGGGITYRVTPWLGLNADYRNFMVIPARAREGVSLGTQYVNRFTTGVSLFVK
ncbi:MAG: outer membrane protein [Vicinamibacterales bacterium]